MRSHTQSDSFFDNGAIHRVACIGTYPPRRCGIATFTQDLAVALATAYPAVEVRVVAINDRDQGYDYDDRVCFEIAMEDPAAYRRAAEFLNMNNYDLVCLQHEFGIFGGPVGSHVLGMLRRLRMPVVTTCHTVLKQPEDPWRAGMIAVAGLSDRLVVMNPMACDFFAQGYGLDPAKIDHIPHGVPDVPFVDSGFHKDRFGIAGRPAALTFGLLNPSKGLEYAIRALPAVIRTHPDFVYIILGATHPAMLRLQGEDYRTQLQRLGEELGVGEHLMFHNRYVSLGELVDFIGAADFYITPYLNEDQITSGTLAYSVGAGKAVVSTPYYHAQDLLADGRGVLVPFRDPDAIAVALNRLLDDEVERQAMRKRAYIHGRDMIWSTVAQRYMRAFAQARQGHRAHLAGRARDPAEQPKANLELPPLTLRHLRHLADDTGLLRHAVLTVPDRSGGYRTADQAGALRLCVDLEGIIAPENQDELASWAARYLAFLCHAIGGNADAVAERLTYARTWDDQVVGDDVLGSIVHALGAVLGRSRMVGTRGLAAQLFAQMLQRAASFTEPLACARVVLGIHEYFRRFAGDHHARQLRLALAERLLSACRTARHPDWHWFTDPVGPAAATLAHALLLSGYWTSHGEMFDAGLECLAWLTALAVDDHGRLRPVGEDGGLRRGHPPRYASQHPGDAAAMVAACQEARRLTSDSRWAVEADRAFQWFLGRNELGMPLYDARTGGCRDCLLVDNLNENQGAPATLAFWLAYAEMWRGEYLQTHGESDRDDLRALRPDRVTPLCDPGRSLFDPGLAAMPTGPTV
ncbi:MAG: glycosyltransferase family 4 protein [Planctomycetota bacterium]